MRAAAKCDLFSVFFSSWQESTLQASPIALLMHAKRRNSFGTFAICSGSLGPGTRDDAFLSPAQTVWLFTFTQQASGQRSERISSLWQEGSLQNLCVCMHTYTDLLFLRSPRRNLLLPFFFPSCASFFFPRIFLFATKKISFLSSHAQNPQCVSLPSLMSSSVCMQVEIYSLPS